jgi:hypothetical protein
LNLVAKLIERCTTGVWGNSYVEICGASLGFAFTSGMLAGEDAASFVK